MMWFFWLMLFICFALILLLLMRVATMRSYIHQINTFVSKAVTLQEMEQYFAKLAVPTQGNFPLPAA